MKKTSKSIIGVDVSKDKLDIFFSPIKKHKTYRNDESGIKKLLKTINSTKDYVVMESTGGYQFELCLSLEEDEIRYSVVNPQYIKRFRESFGIKAKTDKLDSQIICSYGEQMELRETKMGGKNLRLLRALLTRREQ